MPEVQTDQSREDRIEMEIVVDAYNEEERAMGWYYYLDKQLNFPFKAKWITRTRKSSSAQSQEVEVIGMSSEEDCQQKMFVELLYKEDTAEDVFSVPLSDIEVIEADCDTQEAIADWHYWVKKGYEF